MWTREEVPRPASKLGVMASLVATEHRSACDSSKTGRLPTPCSTIFATIDMDHARSRSLLRVRALAGINAECLVISKRHLSKVHGAPCPPNSVCSRGFNGVATVQAARSEDGPSVNGNGPKARGFHLLLPLKSATASKPFELLPSSNFKLEKRALGTQWELPDACLSD